VFQTGNLTRGVPKVDECGLAEIGKSKEETRGTQFRQVRAARCVIPYVGMLRSSGLIGCVYKMMRMRGVPASPYIAREAGLQVGLRREY
jgi:hypothetical protein